MRSPSPDPFSDMATDSTQPQTQPQVVPPDEEELYVHPDSWGLLVPCSAGQPSGIIQLRKKASAQVPSPWPRALEEHTFRIGRGSANDFVLPGQKISKSKRLSLGSPYMGLQAVTTANLFGRVGQVISPARTMLLLCTTIAPTVLL